MLDIEKLDDELYAAAYGLPSVDDFDIVWKNIKEQPEILR